MEKPQDDEPGLELLQVIETDGCPQAELALLRDLLHSADPTELRNYPDPLADLGACKHRLQAMRCEYISARVRAEELEEELKKSRYDVGRLEKHTQFLQSTLDQMRASRAWRLVEKCNRLRRTVSRLFQRGRTLLGHKGATHVP
ncbi:MAG TPA: hypothetical protein VH682_20385 [Gemmataceae bacterium]